jgi:radical SAM-linked protein
MARQQPRPTGPAPLPPVQRLAIRYAKRGRMRFASHRDISRAVERGVRRAGLPVAHSAGFSPHPKISYAGGAPTGAASEAEFLEISLTAALEPETVRLRLDAALPDGIDVIEVHDLAAAPAQRLEASDWKVVLPGVAPADAAAAVAVFLAAEHAEVERRTSNGVRRLDTRAGVVTLELDQRATTDEQPDCAILRMVVRHLTPAVRPEDILVALRQLSALEPVSPAVVTRLAQGPLGVDAAVTAASAAGPGESAGDPVAPGPAAPAGLAGPETPVPATTATEAPRRDVRGAA